MKFVDSTDIEVIAGKGGDGTISFQSAKGRPKMGPDGGNGGMGGNVVFVGDDHINTLSTLRFRRTFKAEDGCKGGANNCTGRSGAHLYINVPLGTEVYEGEVKIGEVLEAGQELVAAEGGWRGLGNWVFRSSLQRAPYKATEGKKGEHKQLRCELKLIADVGLAGFPNAGKSTLLSCVTSARPKIADYPFTTLTPQLGVVESGFLPDFHDAFVMADIPGLLEGASEGKGLGHTFLKHLERTKIVLYVLDPFTEEEDPYVLYTKLRHELDAFSPMFAKKRAVIAINKMDLATEEGAFEAFCKSFKTEGLEVLPISCATVQGLRPLMLHLVKLLRERGDEQEASAPIDAFAVNA